MRLGLATFQAPLYCHAADAHEVANRCRVDHTFSNRHLVDRDFEVIPAVGHTPGATCFLWDSGEHRCLFTGDTINFSHGERPAVVVDSSDRDQYLTSLLAQAHGNLRRAGLLDVLQLCVHDAGAVLTAGAELVVAVAGRPSPRPHYDSSRSL